MSEAWQRYEQARDKYGSATALLGLRNATRSATSVDELRMADDLAELDDAVRALEGELLDALESMNAWKDDVLSVLDAIKWKHLQHVGFTHGHPRYETVYDALNNVRNHAPGSTALLRSRGRLEGE
jgi:hypothetical protein